MSTLTILVGDMASGKTEYIINEIKEHIRTNPLVLGQEPKKWMVLVPEQCSLGYEQYLISSLPSSAPAYLEVTSFPHLARITPKDLGHAIEEYLDPQSEALFVWKAYDETLQTLKTKHSKPSLSVITKTIQDLKEYRTLHIDPETYKRLNENIESEILKDKLHDLTILNGFVESQIENVYHNNIDELSQLITLLNEEKPYLGCKFYIDCFNGFTKPQYDVIQALLSQCDVTISIAMSEKNAGLRIDTLEAITTIKRLEDLAKNLYHCTCRKITLDNSPNPDTPTLNYILDNISLIGEAREKNQELDKPVEDFHLVETIDPFDACDYIACDMTKKIRNEGARYKDFLIVCGSATNYLGILDSSLRKCNIPFTFTHQSKILSLDPIKTLFCALNIFVYHWQSNDVLTFLKCSFAKLNNNMNSGVINRLELYCKTWNITQTKWKDNNDWKMSPSGYNDSSFSKEFDDEILSSINQARKTFLPLLIELENSTCSPAPTKQYLKAISDFMLNLDYQNHIQQLQDEFKEEGNHELAQIYESLWDSIVETINKLDFLFGDVVINLEQFIDMLKVAFGSVTIGHLPATLDSVVVSEISIVRELQKKYVYILGANQGELPVFPKENTTFSEYERTILENEQITGLDSYEVLTSRAYFDFYRALSLASKSVCLLYTLNSCNMDAQYPCEAITTIHSLFGKTITNDKGEQVWKTGYPTEIIRDNQLLDILCSPDMAFERLGHTLKTNKARGEVLKEALLEMPQYRQLVENFDTAIQNNNLRLSQDICDTLFKKEMGLSQSAITKYTECPFSYYCNYLLRLKPTQKAVFSSNIAGTLVHKILELSLSEMTSNPIYSIQNLSLNPKLISGLVNTLFTQTINDLVPIEEQEKNMNKRYFKMILRQLVYILSNIIEELKHSDFHPKMFELHIDKEHAQNPAPIDIKLDNGKTVFIRGTIDRIDGYIDDDTCYIRVVDYKTGGNKKNDTELYKKNDFQLDLYLLSIWKTQSKSFKEALGITEHGTIKPASMLYLTSLTKQKAHESSIDPTLGVKHYIYQSFVREGKILDDEKIKQHLDHSPNSKYTSKLVPLTEQEFEDRELDIQNRVKELAQELESGNISATCQIGCDYCPYRFICRTFENVNDEEA